ncbi:MAG: outer membrane beta-barrel protein [Candidatus Krumholzibacteriota bacterium]|nr:outer membrane beta-barrel protein [Candidatus Krumholzibacteriota bacterium]
MMKRRLAVLTSVVSIIAVMMPCVPYAVSAGETLEQGSMRLDLGGGIGFYNMSNINDEYIDWVSGALGIFEDKIEAGPGFSGSVGYMVSPRISVDIGITFLKGISEGDGTIEGEDAFGDPFFMDFDSELRTTLLATEVKSRYYIPVGAVDLFVGAGLAWCYGKAVIDIDFSAEMPDGDTYTAHGLGLAASLGGYWEVRRPFSIFCEAGYRHYKTGTLKDSDGEKWTMDILDGNPEIDLDFSGFFIVGGISIAIPR